MMLSLISVFVVIVCLCCTVIPIRAGKYVFRAALNDYELGRRIRNYF